MIESRFVIVTVMVTAAGWRFAVSRVLLVCMYFWCSIVCCVSV